MGRGGPLTQPLSCLTGPSHSARGPVSLLGRPSQIGQWTLRTPDLPSVHLSQRLSVQPPPVHLDAGLPESESQTDTHTSAPSECDQRANKGPRPPFSHAGARHHAMPGMQLVIGAHTSKVDRGPTAAFNNDCAFQESRVHVVPDMPCDPHPGALSHQTRHSRPQALESEVPEH